MLLCDLEGMEPAPNLQIRTHQEAAFCFIPKLGERGHSKTRAYKTTGGQTRSERAERSLCLTQLWRFRGPSRDL